MTLEDFFTLTEMKNGLATPSRVEELISVMQQQKDCAMNNLRDTARQWSTVASTLAATENKDCLTHFVKSNGLSYLNQWLQEALKCSNVVADFAVEELLNALLGSLERLPINKEDYVSSGIQFIVEQLIGSKNIHIKEKARTLSETWKHAIENDVGHQDMNKDEKCKDGNLKPPGDVRVVDGANLVLPHVVDISTCGEEPEESNNREKSVECMDVSQSDKPSDLLTSTANKSIPANAKSEDMDVLPSSLVPNSCREDLSGTCGSNASEDVADNHCVASARKDDIVPDTKMEVDKNGVCLSESDQKECSKVPPTSDSSVSSLAHKPERSVSCKFDAKEIKSHKLDTIDTLLRSASIDCVVPKYLRNVDLKPDMQDILSNESKLTFKDLETSLDKKGAIGGTSEVKGPKVNFCRSDAVASHNSSKAMDRKSTVGMDRSSELGLEYGEIDALEVARQVAIEVEREVVDYREPFCSSSPDCNSREEMDPQRSDEHEDQTANVEQNGKDHDDATTPKDDNKMISESIADKGADKCEQDVEMSMDVELSNPVTHESSNKANKNRCVFDLNEDVYVEEFRDCLINSTPNNSGNVSAPIAVAASKGAPFLLVSPLRFEGELGWKGSAATSAFRPASPRRTPVVEKTSSGHKRKANLIEIDLNVADIGDYPVSVKSIHQEDSTEVCSRRSDRLKLDLNRVEEEDMPPIPSSDWSLPHLNGNRTMSPASSSSSRQPTMRNFDLNDNPSFLDAMGSHNYMKISSKTENPGITVMGSKISERKDYLTGTPQSLMGNGPTIMPYGHFPLHAYGYNGHMMGPSISFPPPLYGHGNIPYMVDLRGATVVPQILSTAGLTTASSAIPPFLASATNTSLGLNGAGTSQSGLDLNSMENGNFKNFFFQGRIGLTEDQVRVASQPGGSMNKKEADSGWEPYNFVASWQ